MVRRTRTILFLCTLLVVAWISAWYGMGRGYTSQVTPHHEHLIEGWHPDGWLAPVATANFPALSSSGNRAKVKFDAWRPPGVGPALLKISVCGAPAAEFAVTTEGPYEFSLGGACEPREVRFSVSNPFSSDERSLGVKLRSFEVVSRAGVPILNFPLQIFVTMLLAFTSGILALLLPGVPGRVASLAFPVFSLILTRGATLADVRNLFALWTVITISLLGALCCLRHRYRGEGRPPEGERLSAATYFVGAIMLLGAALRFYGIDFGLPGRFHPDETPKVNAIMRMVQHGDLNPRYFLHPSLLLYLSYGVNSIFHLFIDAPFASTLSLAGRTVSAIAGTLSIGLVYLIGRRLYSPFAGIYAALLFAVFPLHVTCSRYMKEDALLLFFLLATTAAVLRAVYERKESYLLLGAVLAGCAAGTKYSGLLAAGIVASAPWLVSKRVLPDRRFLVATSIALLFVPIAFLCTTPYSVLDSDSFLSGFNSERRHMIRGHSASITASSQYWMYHFSRSVLPGVATLPALVGLTGVGLLLWRRRIEDLFIVGLLLAFYLPAEWVRAKPAPQPERYILPCLPFLALAAAEFLRVIANSRMRLVMPALAMLVVAFPVARTVRLANGLYSDTRVQMADWMKANIPHGARVLADYIPYEPHFPNKEFTVEMVRDTNILKLLNEGNIKSLGYDYVLLSSLYYDRFFSQPDELAVRRTVIRGAFQRYEVVKEIRPEYETYGFHNPVITLFAVPPAKEGSQPESIVAMGAQDFSSH